jgi:ParB-like chromosome segregation protein Spo0J
MSEIAIDKLIPYINNARTHSDEQIDQIASSIREFGFRSPVLVGKDNMIIAGHGRVLAAKKLGLKKVPYIDCSDMSEIQTKAYILADNRIALNAGWDEQMLALEIQGLAVSDIDLKLLGFTDKELERFLQNAEDDLGGHDDVNMGESYEIIIECISEYEQRTVLERLTSEGLKCKSLMR